MPHVYDTGLALPQRTAIRNAVIARLGLLKRPTYYLQAVAPLPGEITADEEGFKAIEQAVHGRAPALLVALGRGESASAGMPASTARKEIEIVVYVLSKHARGTVEGRLAGDVASLDVTKDPGIETMLEHIEELLLGWDLGIAGVSEIRPVSEAEIESNEAQTLWEMTFAVRVMRDVNHYRLLTTLLNEIDAQHLVDGADPGNPVSVTRTTVEEEP